MVTISDEHEVGADAYSRHQTRAAPQALGATSLLSLTALGVVFGDIGTSPLYTLHECLGGKHGVALAPENILGILSLIFWSLAMVVAVKYLTIIMRADNGGEGGIFALLALLPNRARPNTDSRSLSLEPAAWAAWLAIAGAALLYGDGMITPAISVLSAIEGLEVAAPAMKPAVLPATCGVLIGLFLLQRRGTSQVGALFGPIMAVWFAAIGVLGVHQIVQHPAVLAAFDPRRAITFFTRHGWRGFLVLGSVVLAVTGGEALYADMGHFGRRPIRLAWFAVAMPALVANYFGQGAQLLSDPALQRSPFFALVPAGPWTYSLVGLSTAATVIASQALISGAFSMTAQAVQLGYLPRLTITHTSQETEGQIYVPEVNWALAVACLALVIGFQKSDRLAAAYGIAVTGTMVITSVLYFEVTRSAWHWPLWKALPMPLLFLSFDLPFFASSLLKLRDGGFVPLLVGAGLFVVMVTWKRGRRIYRSYLATASKPLESLIDPHGAQSPARCPGAGVFLTSHPEGFPPVLMNLVQRIGVMPETVVLLTIEVVDAPRADIGETTVQKLGPGIYRVIIKRGFMETTSVPRGLAYAVQARGLPLDLVSATYYIGRDTFLATSAGKMGRLGEWFFSVMARNTRSATEHFDIPAHRVIEIGSRIDL